MNSAVCVFTFVKHYLRDLREHGVISASEHAKLLGYVRSRDYATLASCRDAFSGALRSGLLYSSILQIEALFKKNAQFSKPSVTRAAALQTFYEGEEQCRATNIRLEEYFFDGLNSQFGEYILRAQRRISGVLGNFRTFLDELPRNFRITAGATSTRSRRTSQPFRKISIKPTCSRTAAPYVTTLGNFFGYRVKPRVVGSFNRVTFVAKTWKTDRTIACEHEANLGLQLAFDGYVKRRLLHIGIDLSDQSPNQRVARKGSIDGSYATIDLKAASDTLAYNLVAMLLPYPWFQYLDDIRAKIGQISKTDAPVYYEKFSSMGNGATFCLETLIFEALCHAVGSKTHLVYGDDIVIETKYAVALIELLSFCGFTTNEEKSFLSGPFRESCGGSFFEGVNITPFYLKGGKSLASLFHNVNGLRSIAFPHGHAWSYLKEIVYSLELRKRLFVPSSDDTRAGIHIHVSQCYRIGVFRRRKGHASWDQMIYRCLSPKDPVLTCHDSRALFLWYLKKFQAPNERNSILKQKPRRVPSYLDGPVSYRFSWRRYSVVAGQADHSLILWSDYLLSSDSK